ncbi:DUF6090 family protein [Flagellimonas nanhaiensis]|uniref:Uncharacterized protein n=1 Tax=Flagellimonas nanhaiensis TaxID=2292706 RepID=A0A371JNH3_9FLAO|nr:DUF6090 family protein [Allomuricauda nanhaiensis]RDY58791.1 hypothetical protein DX873_14075 [Allomuricauda nanhaiensis]
MIKFFRKIRKQLLAEGKFGNYLLYAIGEIILVVIGILIALAINNSNENRIKREKEQVYLAGLQEEFETSKIKLEELIKVNRQSYEAAKTMVSFSYNEISLSEEELSNLFIDAFAYDIFFNPNNSMLTEMINSGSLKDISNDTLRFRLTNWIATIDDIEKQEKLLSDQRNNVINMFKAESYSIRTVLDQTGMSAELGLPKEKNPMSNMDALNSKSFENSILLFIITSLATETAHYTPLMHSLDAILELLDGEIRE